MDQPLTVALLLLLCLRGRAQLQTSCPYRCQCFMPDQVLCADESMSSLPRNMSRQVKDFIVMTTAVSYLFPHTLEDSPQLTKLIFLSNALRSINSQSFEHLIELQELEISGNPSLEHLYLGTFSKQGNLSKLLLNFNRLKTVLPGMFEPLKQLDVLQMKNNIISDLPSFIFSNCHKLRVLDLSQNQLQEMKTETFSGLVGLEVLKMSHNLLSNLTHETFCAFPHLTELHLDSNKIAQLNDGIFSVLTSLRELNLRGNLLTTFSDRVFGFQSSSLKDLNLQGNRLTQLSSISALTSLTNFVLSSNRLSNLTEDIFRNVTALENLDMSENQLDFLPRAVFRDLLNLKMLNLHKNHLSIVDAKLFEDQMYIQQIYLSENRFQTLPDGLFEPFFMQHSMRLHGNPWRCDCGMRYLHHWLTSHGQGVQMLERVLCESPNFLKKLPIMSIDSDQLVCHLSEDKTHYASSACSLQESNGTLTIKCRASKCKPLTVNVHFQEDDGSIKEHVLKNEPDYSQCINETTSEKHYPYSSRSGSNTGSFGDDVKRMTLWMKERKEEESISLERSCVLLFQVSQSIELEKLNTLG
ncbi:carboxypeptidase N subunit 2 [Gouania willdenowi]|uniref:carboxypeptidase N subunit 2 n=1 Tax=Gouania willdenowi TaxID=441366 RepID=UPI00105621E3|nr:carboxypeptidase N subunit 2-like [Gouania willdenowi]